MNNKKGFTILELVIVLTVITILAGISIPAVSLMIDKSNTTNDIELVRNLNTYFTVNNHKHYSFTEVLKTVNEAGYKVDDLIASNDKNIILWDSINNVFCYDEDMDGTPVYYPENSMKTKLVYDNEYFVVSSTPSERYSTYIYKSGEEITSIDSNRGIDMGDYNKPISITYSSSQVKVNDRFTHDSEIMYRTINKDTTITIKGSPYRVNEYSPFTYDNIITTGLVGEITLTNATLTSFALTGYIEMYSGTVIANSNIIEAIYVEDASKCKIIDNSLDHNSVKKVYVKTAEEKTTLIGNGTNVVESKIIVLDTDINNVKTTAKNDLTSDAVDAGYIEAPGVARIDSTYYETFAAAVSAANTKVSNNESPIITLLKDVTIGDTSININGTDDHPITINGNKTITTYKITPSSTSTTVLGATSTIFDGITIEVKESNGELTSGTYNNCTINCKGTIAGGIYDNSIINASTIGGDAKFTSSCTFLNQSSLTINGGYFASVPHDALKIEENGILTYPDKLTDSAYTNYPYHIFTHSTGQYAVARVNDDYYTSLDAALAALSSSTVDSTIYIYKNNLNLSTSNSYTFNGSNNVIFNLNAKTIKLNGINIKKAYVTINNGTIISNNPFNVYTNSNDTNKSYNSLTISKDTTIKTEVDCIKVLKDTANTNSYSYGTIVNMYGSILLNDGATSSFTAISISKDVLTKFGDDDCSTEVNVTGKINAVGTNTDAVKYGIINSGQIKLNINNATISGLTGVATFGGVNNITNSTINALGKFYAFAYDNNNGKDEVYCKGVGLAIAIQNNIQDLYVYVENGTYTSSASKSIVLANPKYNSGNSKHKIILIDVSTTPNLENEMGYQNTQ